MIILEFIAFSVGAIFTFALWIGIEILEKIKN